MPVKRSPTATAPLPSLPLARARATRPLPSPCTLALNKKDRGGPAGAGLELRGTYWPLNEDGHKIDTTKSAEGQSLNRKSSMCLGLLSIVELRNGAFVSHCLLYAICIKAELLEIVEAYTAFVEAYLTLNMSP